jgi:hypothetical protein
MTFALLISFGLSFGLSAEAPTADALHGEQTPTYDIRIPRSAQEAIWSYSVERGVSYELVLSVFLVDGRSDFSIESMYQEIDTLIFIRDYWVAEGHSNEAIYFLILLSHNRGIDGCYLFMDANESAEEDPYVQQVTQMKYLLEQGLNPLDALDLKIKPGVY